MDNFRDLHYNSISTYLTNEFGCKVVKLALDGNFTCPNRDGKLSFGGCTFCSAMGSGDFTGSMEDQIAKAREKWSKDCKYIAYFQNFTGTYAPAEYLRMLWDEALSHEDVVGLAIATRPDCLDFDVLKLLSEYNEKCFLWVELGLQTSNEKTAASFNRCYKNAVFELAMNNLTNMGIKCVVHLILGLPGETKADFIKSAEYVRRFHPFGLKIHMLHLLKDTAMGQAYLEKPRSLLTKEEYVASVCDILEIMPKDITIHRLTGDGPRDLLIEPLWALDKHSVLNAIQHEFAKRGTYQGIRVE